MTKHDTSAHLRGQFDAASRTHFSFYLRRVLATIAPGARYAHNWHMDAIAEYLAACAAGEVKRLIINLPPRMLKSTIVSVAWPSWLLGHRPTERIMVASYAQSLGIKHSTDCRTVMQALWYRRLFAGTVLSADQNEKEKFATTARGYRLAVSVGGAAIGEGGNVLIVDDPINPLQAGHRHQRDAVNEWFDHTFVTRLDDKRRGAVVVVMQRLHSEDLSGYLLDKGGWEHCCLPAIAPQKTTLVIRDFRHVREAGEALHAAREDVALLEQTKREVGSSNFSAQYQQAPVSLAGSMVKPAWFPRFALGTEMAAGVIQSWDTGVKAGAGHDASACATFVLVDGVHRLVDMTVVRLEYPALKRMVMRHAERFGAEAVLIEDKASGQSLLQDLRQETQIPVIGCMPTVDKVTRLMRVTPMLEAGKMALPMHASWLAAFEQEFFAFPDGAHDDQVDAVSQYLNWRRARENAGEMRVRRL
ncbi:MAG: phage terminase large subunit [Pseudomonadota bacterium]